MVLDAYVEVFYVVGNSYEPDEYFMGTTNYENYDIFETRELAEQAIKEDLEEFDKEEKTRNDYDIAKVTLIVERDSRNI